MAVEARRPLATATLVLASVALALGLSELLVRAFWEVAEPASERTVEPRDKTALQPSDAEGLPVLRSVFELSQKSVRGMHKGLPFRTNRSGFRGPDTPFAPPAGVFRIVVAGDSVTMGTGVLERETYAAQLEDRLNASAAGVRYEVLNVGLSGLNTHQVVRRIENVGLPYGPHLIVYGFTMNDIEGPAYVSTIPRGTGIQRLQRYRRFTDSPSYLLRAVWPRLLSGWELATRPEGTLEHDLHHNYFENPAAWAEVTAGLDRLAGLARERGLCVHVFVHTGIAQLNRLYPFLDVMERVAGAARERGLGASQSFPHFEGRDPTELRLSKWDTHPNPAGHAVLAEALLDGLRALPDECWTPGPGGRPAALQP